MSTIIKRYLPRFTFVTLCLLGIGMAIYFGYFESRGIAQGDPNQVILSESVDIGKVSQPGNYRVLPDAGWELSAMTRTIGGVEDSAFFVYQAWDGNGDFVVQLQSQTPSQGSARAGLMIRQSLDPDAVQATVGLTANGHVDFLRRRSEGSGTDDDGHANVVARGFEDHVVFQRQSPRAFGSDPRNAGGMELPHWLRLVREGEVVSAYHSADGTAWDWVGTESLPLEQWIYVGLTLASHDPAEETVAHFREPDFRALTRLADPVFDPNPEPQPEGDGLLAQYFSDRTFNTLLTTRVDETVNFDWGLGTPVEDGPRDGFSVRWEGLLEAEYSEPYLLHLIADDQALLWLDGRLLIDDWFEHRSSESTAKVTLEAGRKYHLRIDYTEGRRNAAATLAWSSPSTPWTVVPQSQLFSELADSDGDQIPDAWERAFGIQPGEDLDDARREALAATGSPRDNGGGRNRELDIQYVLKEHYVHGTFPGSLGSSQRAVGDSQDWRSVDLSPKGTTGRVESIDGTREQRLTSHSARYGVVNGGHPWILRDDFHFSYRSENSDQEIIARIKEIETASPDALAGAMVRASTAPDSVFVGVVVGPTRESWLIVRATPGAPATMQRMGSSAHWVRLVRQGNAVKAYESTDGAAWRWLATEPFQSRNRALYGLGKQGGSPDAPSSVVFSDVSLKGASESPRSVPPIVGSGDGLKGRYSDGVQQLERVDPTLDFYWGPDEAPDPNLRADQFTVTWEGELQAQYDETYCLELACDDGARLWLDGLLLIEDWHDSEAFARNVRIELEAGRRYPIRIDYYEARDEASARLSWSSPSTPKVPIPQSQLYSSQGAESFSLVGRGLGLFRPRTPASQPDDTESIMGPPAPDAAETTINLVQALDVTQFENPLGDWVIDTEEGGVLSQSRRGSIEYVFNLTDPGMLLLEIAAEPGRPHHEPNHRLWLSVDGQHLSQRLMNANESPMMARQLLPWLGAGEHRLQIYWDNSLGGRSIRFREIALKSIGGADTDGNQVADWIDAELTQSNSLDEVAGSRVSPAFIEGKTVYSALASGTVDGEVFSIHPGAGERWYADVPLNPDQPTTVELAFENGGLIQQQSLTWEATDLTETEDLIIRQGDALLFTIGGGGRQFEKSFVVADGEPIVVAHGAAVPHRFEEPGEFTVTARWRRNDERTIQIRVVQRITVDSPAALVGQWRPWDLPPLPPDVALELDPRIDLDQVAADDANRYRLRTWEPVTRQVVLRLREGGPIVQHIGVEGFRLDMGTATGFARSIEQYKDGGLVVETDTIIMPFRSGVSIRSTMGVAGILFSTGHIARDFDESKFDALGILAQQFYLSPTATRTVSVFVDTYQDNQRINEF